MEIAFTSPRDVGVTKPNTARARTSQFLETPPISRCTKTWVKSCTIFQRQWRVNLRDQMGLWTIYRGIPSSKQPTPCKNFQTPNHAICSISLSSNSLSNARLDPSLPALAYPIARTTLCESKCGLEASSQFSAHGDSALNSPAGSVLVLGSSPEQVV